MVEEVDYILDIHTYLADYYIAEEGVHNFVDILVVDIPVVDILVVDTPVVDILVVGIHVIVVLVVDLDLEKVEQTYSLVVSVEVEFVVD